MRTIVQLFLGLAGEWQILLPLLVAALAVWLLLPRPRPYPWYLGALAGGLALFLGAGLILRTSGVSAEIVLFYAFSALAILGGTMLVAQHNPARAALSFVLVILSTCGLFLILAAPFLMAATIIIYAGAIIVTFLFVLMLAQQAGLSSADARSREPALATFTGFLLLATMLYVLKGYQQTNLVDDLIARTELAIDQESRKDMLAIVEPEQTDQEKQREDRRLFKQSESLLEACGLRRVAQEVKNIGEAWIILDVTEAAPPKVLDDSRKELQKLRAALVDNRARILERLTTGRLPGVEEEARKTPLPLSPLSGSPPSTPSAEIRHDETGRPALPAENAAYLGRSLFTDYLLPVELGGLLLLVATVGAIAIAQRREPGRTN